MLRIKMYPAQNGDAFLLSSAISNILIDGGYATTFDKYILQDLRKLSAEGKSLDLLITTHIDSDHISGIIKFLSLNGPSSQPNIIPVRNIWHNSLRSLTSPYTSKIHPDNAKLLKAIKQRGHPVSEEQGNFVPEQISAKQGSTLAALIHVGQYLWNETDGTKNISLNNIQDLALTDGAITIIAPSEQRLKELLNTWKKQLQKYGYKGQVGSGEFIDDAFELSFEHHNEKPTSPILLSAGARKKLEEVYIPDTSVTNGSSIATIIELDGSHLLMLADAPAEDIVTSLRKLQKQGYPMLFDAIKISHHGSKHNTSPELLELIDAPKYFISSNGNKHNHPDIELLTRIVDRPASFSRTLYFNYSTQASRQLHAYQTQTQIPFTINEDATDWITVGDSE